MTVHLDFARRTQRCDTCHHPRFRDIPDFDQNYHVTLFQKFEFSGASHIKELEGDSTDLLELGVQL